jgi:TonB-linked SusC/RagA family outer membrane protein
MKNILNKLFLTLTLMFLSIGASAQSGTSVTGTVVDSNGESIIGASIIEEGTTNGVITDIDGNYVIKVNSKNATLRFSYIGYKTQSVALKGRTKLDVVLEDESIAMEEVVVVGYGAQKKESVVGAISQVSNKDLLSTPSANVSQALSGKVTGLVTVQTSGAPGADDMSLYIRGRASFAGDNQPLIMVDGVEREFSQIAPDDIESISVLKDASATAVYGVRGANGVVLITTRRGKEAKPVVSLTANWQWSSPTRSDTYLNSYESVKLLEEALANDGLASQYSASDIEMFGKSVKGQLSGVDAMLYPNVDWYDTVLRNSAPAQRYNVNVQGGTKRLRYYVSAEYYDQQGLFKNFSTDQYGNKSNQSYNRIGFRANLDFLMTKDLTFSVNFGTRFEERRGPNSNEAFDGSYSEVFYELNHTPGWLFPVSYNLSSDDGTTRTLYGGTSQYQNNIVGRLANGGFYRATNTINETNFIVNYNMDWLTKGLSAKGMV